jgi:hypothetical protein
MELLASNLFQNIVNWHSEKSHHRYALLALPGAKSKGGHRVAALGKVGCSTLEKPLEHTIFARDALDIRHWIQA